jgi:hypothetical protein
VIEAPSGDGMTTKRLVLREWRLPPMKDRYD